jgi:hypothetical protein
VRGTVEFSCGLGLIPITVHAAQHLLIFVGRSSAVRIADFKTVEEVSDERPRNSGRRIEDSRSDRGNE